jgi:hypothetical protein
MGDEFTKRPAFDLHGPTGADSGLLDLVSGKFEHGAELHARRTAGFAGATAEAEIRFVGNRIAQRDAILGNCTKQIDPTPR